MCGRFDFHGTAADLDAVFGSKPTHAAWTPRYNIAPTEQAPIIVAHTGGERRTVLARFGWQGGFLASGQVINARAETVRQRVLFRQAFVERRCIVPAYGFFEWDKAARPRQPCYFTSRSSPLVGLAGLYSPGANKRGDAFVILTTWANALVRRCHARMPVMLDPPDAVAYLRGPSPEARALLLPYAAAGMQGHPVTRAVSRAGFEGPACIAPDTKRRDFWLRHLPLA